MNQNVCSRSLESEEMFGEEARIVDRFSMDFLWEHYVSYHGYEIIIRSVL